MRRPLPTAEEAARILGAKRTRPQRRPPPPIGRKLGKFIKQLDDRFGQGAGGLKEHWKEIAGESLWRATEPVMKLIKPRGGGVGTLEIRVDGPAAALIQHQAPAILSRVNLFLGEGSAGKLRIIQGPVRAPVGAAPPRRRKPPLDAGTEASLAASVDEAAPGLKDALIKLGRAVLREPVR